MLEVGEKILDERKRYKLDGREWDMNQLCRHMQRDQRCWSWGAHAYRNVNRVCLRFMVNGRHHKGHVYVHLEGNDTFTIYLTNRSGVIKKRIEDVYLEDLIDHIDSEVEYIDAYAR